MSVSERLPKSSTVAALRLAGAGIAGGLLGGVAMIGVMILSMGASGMGYATPLNLGMASFVFTVAPPKSMLPMLMGLMGIHVPAAMMPQVMAMLRSPHLSPAMMQQLTALLASMHVPSATAHTMGLLITGRATNGTVATLLSQMSPAAQGTVMRSMPVVASHVLVSSILHFAFAAFVGLVFAGILTGVAWLALPMMRSSAGLIGGSVIGSALLYVLMRWILLPATNPMMGLVPQGWFLLAHLLFGLVVGIVVAWAFRRSGVLEALPRER
ncbi:MAG: hypothetical protein ACP5QO_08325 [Clostridia bacterium]